MQPHKGDIIKKEANHKVGPVLLAVGLFVIIGMALLYQAENLLRNSDPKKVAAALYPPVKMRGLALQGQALEAQKEQRLLMVYGSSELTLADRFHPSSFFAGNSVPFVPFVSGRGGCQSLIQAMNLAALGSQIQGKKLVVILSPQWFGQDGLSQDYFRGNFSPLHAYTMILDGKFDSLIKKELALRLLDFSEVRTYPVLFLMLKGLSGQSEVAAYLFPALKPLAAVNRWFLVQADRLRSVNLLISQQTDQESEKPDNAWKKSVAAVGSNGFSDAERNYLLDIGTEEGRQACTNNPYYISDETFNRRFAAQLTELQGSGVNISYVTSPEYDDLRLLLDILKNARAEALFVLVPVNGFWYDYLGFPKTDRIEHYAKTRKIIASAGFAVSDLTSYEYEPYFLRDDMHLGWKGWVYVDEALAKFYFN